MAQNKVLSSFVNLFQKLKKQNLKNHLISNVKLSINILIKTL